jgi:GTP-binding protein
MTLEQAIAYIQDDELVEVTPKVIPHPQTAPGPARAQRASRKARRPEALS